MTNRTIIDTGPLVGLIRRDDQWSAWSTKVADELPPPFFTCEPVLTEASYLLKNFAGGVDQLLGMVEDGLIVVDFAAALEARQLRSLIHKYHDIPMSLADASVVRMTEIHRDSTVLTVDTGFVIYRRNHNERIPLISPFN